MKKILKQVLSVAICIAISTVAGVLLLMGVYCLPADWVGDDMLSSAQTMQSEGAYPVFPNAGQLDNYTDAIMILESNYKGTDSVLEKALLVKRYSVGDLNPAESLVDIYVNGNADYTVQSYPRYWHGYLIFVKPLLSVMSYSTLRVFNRIVQIFLMAFTVFLFIAKRLKRYIVPYAFLILLLKPLALYRSLQFSTCFYVLAIGILVILLLPDIKKYAFYIFLFLGIATAYFDFLTYPLATFGVPMVMYLAVTGNIAEKFKNRLLEILKLAALWGCGYGGMWLSKWVVCGIFTEHDIISEVLERILMRSSLSAGTESRFTVQNALDRNITMFKENDYIFWASVFVALAIVYFVVCIVRNKPSVWTVCKTVLPYLLVSLLPLMWYAVTINHSVIHSFFTNKLLIVAAFARLCMFLSLPFGRGDKVMPKPDSAHS